MHLELLCPACGACDFDFDDYESVVLLAPNLALMQFGCPRCKIHLSATIKLDQKMQHTIKQRLAKQEQIAAEKLTGADADASTETLTAPESCKDFEQTSSDRQHSNEYRLIDEYECATGERLSYSANLIVDSYAMEYGMVRTLRSAGSELKEELEAFKNQLDSIETVEQVIKEIDSYYPIQEQHKKRDV